MKLHHAKPQNVHLESSHHVYHFQLERLEVSLSFERMFGYRYRIFFGHGSRQTLLAFLIDADAFEYHMHRWITMEKREKISEATIRTFASHGCSNRRLK